MRVLVTGISGSGKSSLVAELRHRGYLAFDVDDDGYSAPLPDGTWGWRVDAIRSLFDELGEQLLFFAGCSEEQATFDFDIKVLLEAPVEVIRSRLRQRNTNPFGKTDAERDRVLADMEWVLPLLRASADLVIDTAHTTVGEVADAVIEVVEALRA